MHTDPAINRLLHSWDIAYGSTTHLGVRETFANLDDMVSYLEHVFEGWHDATIADALRHGGLVDNRIAGPGQLGYILSIPWSFHQSLGDDPEFTLDQCVQGIADYLNVTGTYTSNWNESLLLEPVRLFVGRSKSDIKRVLKAHPTEHLRRYSHIRKSLDAGVSGEYLCAIRFGYETLTERKRGIGGFEPEAIAELERRGVPADYANEFSACVLGGLYRNAERIAELHDLGVPAWYFTTANDACLADLTYALPERLDYETVLQAWRDGIRIEYLTA